MRTGIFVYENTKVTIETQEDNLQLAQLNGPLRPLGRSNELVLDKGVYKIHSSAPVVVSESHVYVEVTLNDKDEFPEPRPQLLTPLGEYTLRSVQDFFTIDIARNFDNP